MFIDVRMCPVTTSKCHILLPLMVKPVSLLSFIDISLIKLHCLNILHSLLFHYLTLNVSCHTAVNQERIFCSNHDLVFPEKNSLFMSAFCELFNIFRSMQEVQLDKNVRLLDSPGIVMATGDETSAHTILRNAVKVEQIEDPAAPVEIILSRCRKDQMMMQYKVIIIEVCKLLHILVI